MNRVNYNLLKHTIPPSIKTTQTLANSSHNITLQERKQYRFKKISTNSLLNTFYKLFTQILTHRMTKQLNFLEPREQVKLGKDIHNGPSLY